MRRASRARRSSSSSSWPSLAVVALYLFLTSSSSSSQPEQSCRPLPAPCSEIARERERAREQVRVRAVRASLPLTSDARGRFCKRRRRELLSEIVLEELCSRSGRASSQRRQLEKADQPRPRAPPPPGTLAVLQMLHWPSPTLEWTQEQVFRCRARSTVSALALVARAGERDEAALYSSSRATAHRPHTHRAASARSPPRRAHSPRAGHPPCPCRPRPSRTPRRS